MGRKRRTTWAWRSRSTTCRSRSASSSFRRTSPSPFPPERSASMLGPSGTGKSVLLKTLIGLLKPDKGSIVIEGTDIASCSERELYEIRKLFGVLFQDGAMFGSMNLYDNVAFPLREHTKKSESEIRAHRHGEDGPGRPRRGRDRAPRRNLRWHAQARRPGPGPGARPRDRAVRRARLRPRPRSYVVPQPAHRRSQRPDRRDVPDRHPRHQHRPDGPRQHRPALPPPPGRCSAPGRCCSPPRSPSSASSSTPRWSDRSACPRRRTPTSSRPSGVRSFAAAADPVAARTFQRHPTP